jgi:hypothetical protein
MQQLGLFTTEDIKPVEQRTTVRLGRESARTPRIKRRREAAARLKEVMKLKN